DVPSELNNNLLCNQSTSAFTWSSPRSISTRLLNGSLHLHIVPIYLVVFKGSYLISQWDILSLGRLHAYMLSAFIRSEPSCPAVLLAEQLVRQRFARPGPLVLGTAPIKYPAPTTDRDRTVSRRSEPSSRTALIGEQPNPWDRIQ